MQNDDNQSEEKPLKGTGHYMFDQFSKGFDSNKQTMGKTLNQPVQPVPVKICIDEVAVGARNQNMMLEEFPVGYDPNKMEEENKEQQIPLKQRLKSKVFKQRQQAFDNLQQLFEETQDENDPIFQEYFEMFVPFIQDSHPMCQEKALNVIVFWMKKMGNLSQLDAQKVIEICRNILEKAYSIVGKPNIKQSSMEIFCILFEKGQKANVISSILSSILNKNNKVCCCSIVMISELLANFGIKQLDHLKPFFNDILTLSESSQATVRQNCIIFYKDAYKWMGDSIKIFTKQLKKQQQEELDIFFESYEQVEMKPLRVIEENAGGKGKKNDNDINQYDLVEAKNVYKPYQDDWCDKILQLSKWQEKVEIMNPMVRDLHYPKHTSTSNFYPLFSLTKKLLLEQNVNIMQIGIKISGLMAEGLRKVFSNSAKNLIYNLLQKLKDKKTFIINETQTTILNFFNYCMNLEEIGDDLKESLQDKNPNFKANIINLLEKILEKNHANSKQGFKILLVTLKKLFEDGNPEVREKSLILAGKLKNQYGEGFFGNLLQDVNQKQMIKINSCCQQPDNIGKPTIIVEEKQTILPRQLTATSLQSGEVQQKSTIFIALDQCLEKLISMGYNEDTLKKLSTIAEHKLQALQELNTSQIISGSEQYLLCLLKYKFKDWKDQNLIKEVCQLVEKISQQKQEEQLLPLYIGLVIEKISDYKCIDIISEIMKNLCKKMGPKPTLNSLHQLLDIKKANPKTLENIQQNLIKLIQSFNIKHMPVKILINIMKESLQHQNSLVKKEAISLGKVLYQYIGKDFKNMVSDLVGNPLKILQAEIEKTSVLTENQKKTLQCETIDEIMEEEEIVSNVITKRADISRDINLIIRHLNDNDWKVRKDGLEKLQALISENYNQISLNGLRDLVDVLKNKLSDPNKGLVIKFVQFVGQFAEAVGPDIKKYEKVLLPGLISNLSDKQVTLRQDVFCSLEKFASLIGIESILNQFPAFLNHESMELKKDILTWVLQNRDYLPNIDLKPYINPLLNQLASKQKEIRQLSEELLSVLSPLINMNTFVNSMSNFKPAIQQQLKQIIEKVYGMNLPNEYQTMSNQIQNPQKNTIKNQQIQMESLKEQRIINEKNNSWPYDCLDDTLIENLQKDFFTQQIPCDLIQQLFSRDYRRNIEAANFIKLNLTQAAEISDLIIKWSSMMLHGQMNDEVSESILQMYMSLINILHQETYQLMDFESQIFLNSLTQYIKQNKNKFLNFDIMLNIFESIKQIVYSNIIVSFLFQKLQDPENLQIQNEILQILGSVYVNDISAYLVHLAQIPGINFNSQFITNLQKAYGSAELIREGFILPQNQNINQYEMVIQPLTTQQPLIFENTILNSTPGKYSIYKSLNTLKDINYLNWEQKNDEIINISEYLNQESQNIRQSSNVNDIFDSMIEIFQNFVKNKSTYQCPSEFIFNFLNLMNKFVSDRDIIFYLSSGNLYSLTSILLNQMLLENVNKNDADSEQMVKIINSITLKLLESSDWTKMILCLFDILIQSKKAEDYNKLIGLIVKCILKQAKGIEKIYNQIDVQQLLLKFHEFNVLFIKHTQQFNDIGVKTIKTVLSELIKAIGSDRMLEYYKILNTQPVKDDYISIWLAGLIGEVSIPQNDKNISIIAQRKSQIKQQFQQIQNTIDEKMRPLVEGIVKNEQVEKCIQSLHELIIQNPQLQWSGYFANNQNYHEHIALVHQRLKQLDEEGNENFNNIQNSGNKNKKSPMNMKRTDMIDKNFDAMKHKFMGENQATIDQMSLSNQKQIQTLNFMKSKMGNINQ